MLYFICPSESFLCLNFPEPGISIQRPSGYTLLMVEEHPFLLYKSAKNNLGLSPIDIRVFPIISFSPHANPILGANGGMNMSSAKLRLGIYYLRKYCSFDFLK